MRSPTAVRLLTDPAYHPSDKPTRAMHLSVALRSAAIAAASFADSEEVKDSAQRVRYRALAQSLEAQRNSLRVEVADVVHG
jgi:cytochrome c-type biogenesis protein CcmH/NrfF